MRHVYIRGIMSLVWLGAAMINGVSGNCETTALYVVLSGVFLYSACAAWKKGIDNEGGR